jgi:hypothetical protein
MKFPLVLISDAYTFSAFTFRTLHHHNVYDVEHTKMFHAFVNNVGISMFMIYHHTKLKGLVTAIHSLLTPNARTYTDFKHLLFSQKRLLTEVYVPPSQKKLTSQKISGPYTEWHY